MRPISREAPRELAGNYEIRSDDVTTRHLFLHGKLSKLRAAYML